MLMILRKERKPLSTRRVLWSVLDQIVSSGTNFALLLVVVQTIGTRGVGAFSIAYAVYFIILVLAKGLSVEPLLVRCSSMNEREWRRSARLATGQAVIIGLIAAIAAVGVGGIFAGPLAEALIPLGIAMPGLLLQDALRFVFIAERRPLAACLNDTLWLTTSIGLFVLLSKQGVSGLAPVVGAWGLAGAVSGVVGLWQAGFIASPLGATTWFREHRDVSLGFAGDYLAQRGSQQVALMLVGAVGGLGVVGAIGAARLLFAPLTTVQSGLNVIAIPEAARLRERGPSVLGRFAVAVAGALAGLMACAGIVLLTLPNELGQLLLRENWDNARPLIVPMTVLSTATAAGGGFWVVLRVLEAARATFLLRAGFGLVAVVSAVLGTWGWGAAGGVWGLAVGSVFLSIAMAAVTRGRLRAMHSLPSSDQASLTGPGMGNSLMPDAGTPSGREFRGESPG